MLCWRAQSLQCASRSPVSSCSLGRRNEREPRRTESLPQRARWARRRDRADLYPALDEGGGSVTPDRCGKEAIQRRRPFRNAQSPPFAATIFVTRARFSSAPSAPSAVKMLFAVRWRDSATRGGMVRSARKPADSRGRHRPAANVTRADDRERPCGRSGLRESGAHRFVG